MDTKEKARTGEHRNGLQQSIALSKVKDFNTDSLGGLLNLVKKSEAYKQRKQGLKGRKLNGGVR